MFTILLRKQNVSMADLGLAGKGFHKIKEEKTMKYGVLSENSRKLKAYEHRCIRHKIAYL